MNKLFTSIAAVSLGLTMAIGVGTAVGTSVSKEAVRADAAYGTAEELACPAGTVSNNQMSFSTSSFNIVHAKGTGSSFASYSPWRVYSNNTVTISSKTGSVKIGKVEFVHSGTYYSTISCTSPTGGTVTMATTSGGTSTWTIADASATNSVAFKVTGSSQSRWSKIKIYPVQESTTQATGISFSPSSLTVSGGDSGTFTPTLTGGSGNYEKTISWSSDNPAIIPNPSNSEDGQAVNFTAANPDINTTVTLTGTVVSPGSASASISITVNHAVEYTITYDANGGSGSMSSSINHVSANGFTAPTGMEFKEWNTQADGNGTTYAVGATVNADTDLFAIWQRLRYTTGFESSEGFTATTTYNTTKVDGPTGKQWQFVNGTAASGNVITGEQSAQMRKYKDTTGNPNINMQFNIDEIHSISFNAKGGTANMGVEVFYSTNNGSSWTSIGTETVGTSVVSVEKEISSYVASGRFKIEYTGANPSKDNRWMSIDDIVVETLSATPTITSVSLSPSDDLTLKVGNDETYTVTISGTNLTGNETVDVVLTDDLGDYVSIDDDSGLKNGDTFTVTATVAGGIGELYISYNSGTVDSAHITVMTEEAKIMSSISIHASGTTSYFTGNTFSTTGFEIYANYTDETSEDVTANSIFELMRSGSPLPISTALVTTDDTIRVSYTESGSTQTVNITISVIDDYVSSLSWGNRGTVDCYEQTTLGSAVSTSSWTFTATWASGAQTHPTYGSGSGDVHVGLYNTHSPESEGTALSNSYVFTSNDDGKYLVACYNGVFSKSNEQVSITRVINNVMEPTEAGFDITTSISVGDTVYLASTVRELSGINTTSKKYGLATAFTEKPSKLYPLTVSEGSEAGSYAFANSSGDYLSVTNDNTLNVNGTLSNTTSFTVSFDDNGNATITSLAYTTRSIQYNANSGQERFANYTSGGQTAVQLWKDVAAGEKNIANMPSHILAQRVVLEYADDFLDTLDDICVSYGSTDPEALSEAWGNLATQYDNWINNGDKGLEGDEITHAKKLFKYASDNKTGDVLQRMVDQYDWIVSHYGELENFLHDDAGRDSLYDSTGRVAILADVNSSNIIPIIVIVSLISVSAIGGYFYIRRRKEQ